jgi:hypothetical protein
MAPRRIGPGGSGQKVRSLLPPGAASGWMQGCDALDEQRLWLAAGEPGGGEEERAPGSNPAKACCG